MVEKQFQFGEYILKVNEQETHTNAGDYSCITYDVGGIGKVKVTLPVTVIEHEHGKEKEAEQLKKTLEEKTDWGSIIGIKVRERS